MEYFKDEVERFLSIFPLILREEISKLPIDNLIEIVLDYGRPTEARFSNGFHRFSNLIITKEILAEVIGCVGEFGLDNRAGIECTLHRISCIRNRHNEIIGLTCRLGRALQGTIDMIDDLIRSGKSILFLGKPGTGKTTKLRETARILADEVEKRVIIIDTSNEIGGDGDVPHPAVGFARRMQVKQPALQHQIMIEAVENHTPEVIIIDEIGTEAEAAAARTIAERGVQLIGTAHGQTLDNLMMNPTLSDLIGGIQVVTLSDDEAKRRGTQKSVLERKAPPTFDIIIELMDYDKIAVHNNVLSSIDASLKGAISRPQIRMRTISGQLEMVKEEDVPLKPVAIENQNLFPRLKENRLFVPPTTNIELPVRIYAYGVARTRLEKAIQEKQMNAYVCNDICQADVIMIIRSTYQNKPQKINQIDKNIPLVVINSNAYKQILDGLNKLNAHKKSEQNLEIEAMQEAFQGINQIEKTGKFINLSPQDASIRKKQHHLIKNKKLSGECIGTEPNRYLRISCLTA